MSYRHNVLVILMCKSQIWVNFHTSKEVMQFLSYAKFWVQRKIKHYIIMIKL